MHRLFLHNLYALPFKLSIMEDELGHTKPQEINRQSVESDKVVVAKIHTLNASHREAIRHHLMTLSLNDRYLRFGFNATDQQINIYVDQINFSQDDVFGILDKEHQILGTSHLAYGTASSSANSIAEFGVSVSDQARGMGLGGQLFAYSAQRAANRGIDQMFIHTINKNIPMIKIIKRSGAEVFRDHGEIDAYLTLTTSQNAWVKMRTQVQDSFDLPDYGIKVKLKCFQKKHGGKVE